MIKALLQLVWKLLRRNELTIDTEKCVVCGKCYKLCHHKAIEKSGSGTYTIQTDKCVRCYHCRESCPKQAIG